MQRIAVREGRSPGDQPSFYVDRRAEWLETGWVAFIVSVIVFNPVLGSITPITFILALPVILLLRWELAPIVFGRCWPVILLPMFAMISTTWSSVPGTTFYYSILYLITVLNAIAVGALVRGDAMLKGLFLGFGLYAVMTVLSGQWTVWNGPGGAAFRGLAGSKNSAGDTAGLTLIISIMMLIWAVHKRQLRYGAAAILVIPLALFALWFSRATGALLATAIASAALMMLVLSRSLSVQGRSSVALLALLSVLVAVALSDLWLPTLFDLVLAETGKDAGLTGRADLWRKADQLISERPWLGMGYNAFWLHNNLDAEYLWRMMGIASRRGFNFHNSFREILVHLGYTGLVLFGIVSIIGAARLLAQTIIKPQLPSIMLTTFMIFLLPKLSFEVIGFGDMHFATIIAFAIVASGFSLQLHHSDKRNILSRRDALR